MARSPKISQAFQGMILEKRAAGLSVHTISDYQNTLKKVLLYFPGDHAGSVGAVLRVATR